MAGPCRGSGHHRHRLSQRVPGAPAGSSTPSPAVTRRLCSSPNKAGKSCDPKCRRRLRAARAQGCRFTRSSSCRGKPTPPPSLLVRAARAGPRGRSHSEPRWDRERSACAVGRLPFPWRSLLALERGRAEREEAEELLPRINPECIVTGLRINTKGISAWGVTSCARTQLLLEVGRKHEVTTT